MLLFTETKKILKLTLVCFNDFMHVYASVL